MTLARPLPIEARCGRAGAKRRSVFLAASLFRLSDWPFLVKFGSILMLGVLATTIMARNGQRALEEQAEITRLVVEKDMADAARVAEIGRALHLLNASFYRLTARQAARHDSAAVAAQAPGLERLAGQISEQLSAYAGTLPNSERRDTLSAMARRLIDYKGAIEFFTSMVQVDFASAIDFIEPFDENYRKLTAEIDALIAATAAESTERARLAQTRARAAESDFMIEAATAIAALLCLTLVLAWRLTLSVRRIANATSRLADADMSVDLEPLRRRDELGSVVDALHVFKRNGKRASDTSKRFRDVRVALLALADGRLDIDVPERDSLDEVGAMAQAAQRYKESSLHLAELEAERAQLLEQAVQRRQEALHLAEHDSLTGLPNRRGFLLALRAALDAEIPIGLLLLDLDHFKEINDSLGHPIGDELLRAVSERILAHTPATGRVARLGGDEFAVILPYGDAATCAEIADRLIQAIGEPHQIARHWLRVGVSVGSAAAPFDATDVSGLLANADIALYRAKAAGRSVHHAFEAGHRAALEARAALLELLREAVRTESFQVHYQPKISLVPGAIVGAEALVRWSAPGRGPVSPDRFIPLAEQTGLIGALGAQVLRRACRDAAKWAGDLGRSIPVAVNLSAHQLRDPYLVAQIRETLEETGLPASSLELEITESAVMEDVESVIQTFATLTDMGVSLSIDDFGTGYSSLSYLRRFRVAKMKIDRSFVVDLSTSADARAVAAAVVALGRGLGLKIVAEGIEDLDQRSRLLDLGCDEGQGWLFSRALPFDAFRSFVEKDTADAADRPAAE